MKTKFPTLLARVSAGVFFWLAPSSFAAVLLLTHTGTGSGQIGATSFTNATFTISDTVDTATRQTMAGGYFIDDLSASIAITGVGTYPFSSPTRTFVNNSVTSVGFSRGGFGGSDLFDGPGDPAFSTWDLLTGIGPITGTGTLMQWGSSNGTINTSGGVLTFSNGGSVTTFTAVAVPEPAACAAIAGLSVLAGTSWRRRPR